MKKAVILSTSLVLGMVFVTAAQAFTRINTGIWRGQSYAKNDGSFSHCVVSAKYRRGDRLLFSINSRYVFSIGIADASWNLRKGARYSVSLRVDRRQTIDRRAIAVSDRQLVVVINDRVTFYRQVRRGRRLVISGDGFSRGYSLRGTSRALNAVLNCVRRELRIAGNNKPNEVPNNDGPKPDNAPNNQGPKPDEVPNNQGPKSNAGPDDVGPQAENPPSDKAPKGGVEKPDWRPGLPENPNNNDGPRTDPPPRTADTPKGNDVETSPPRQVTNNNTRKDGKVPPGVTDEQARVLSINILAEAGIAEYKMLRKNPYANAGYQVAWSYAKGKNGALATFGKRKRDFVDTQTSTILASDARNCKGKFASGFRKTDSTNNWWGRRLFTVCTNSTNKRDFAINYSIGLQPNGTATVVATHVSGAGLNDTTVDSEQVDEAIYNSATFRSIGK